MKRKVVSSIEEIVRCVVYSRCSDTESAEREGGSLQQQERMGQDLADQLTAQTGIKHVIVKVLTEEEGVSGKDTNRPKYQEMLKMIRRGSVDAVLGKEISRFCRCVKDAAELLELCEEYRIGLHIRGLTYDPRSPQSSFMVNMLSSMAEFERKMIVERTKSSIRTSIKHESRINGGPVLLGFEKDPARPGHWRINSREIDQVKMLMEHFIKSMSYKSTREEAARLGIRNKNGSPLSKSGIQRLMTNRRYAGELRLPNDEEEEQFVPMSCGPAIPMEFFEKVRECVGIIATQYARKNRGEGYQFLLTGLVEFKDGTQLSGTSGTGRDGQKYYYYRGKAIRLTVPATPLEESVMRSLRVFEKDEQMTAYAGELRKNSTSRVGFLEAQLADVRNGLRKLDSEESKLGDQLGASALGSAAIVKWLEGKLAAIENRRAELRRSEDELQGDIVQARSTSIDARALSKSLRKVFDKLDTSPRNVQRGILRQLIHKVVVHNDNKIEVRWLAPTG